MNDDGPHDYSEYASSWLWGGRPLTKEQRAELAKISKEMCCQHGIEACEEHEALLYDLVRQLNTRSQVSEIKGIISPAKDQPTIKQARHSIETAGKKLEQAYDAVFALIGNETARAILERSDRYEDIPGLFSKVGELHEILASASSIKGKQGSRKNPDWVYAFCRKCQDFWFLHMNSGTTLAYRTENDNPFSEWVFQLYSILGDLVGADAPASMLFTAAKELPAKR